MESLLGQFYSRIKGSQEAIASDGLAYILQRSVYAKKTISDLIKTDCGLDIGDISFSPQNVGEKLERPDISGFDNRGNEVIIIETKFWSALTENQPQEYLRRLKNDSVILFICPSLRVRSLYNELIRELNASLLKNHTYSGKHLIALKESKQIVIKTWNEILHAIKLSLSQENNYFLLADIEQIIGFCEVIEKNTFLPIQKAELAPHFAKRINSYCDLLDKIVDELKKRGKIDTKRLQATGQRWGYTRYGRIDNFGIALNLDFDFWANHQDTPFWIAIHTRLDEKGGWVVSPQLLSACNIVSAKLKINLYLKENRIPCFPLFPLVGELEDIVIKNIANQIISLTNSIRHQLCDLR